MASLTGKTIGKYRIGPIIGEGGMGSVYLGQDTVLGRQVAVKVLHGHLSRSRDITDRFRNEAITQARLQHPNIVTLYDFVPMDDLWLIAMEYVVGGRSLGDLIHGRALPQRLACDILRQLLRAVAFAHGEKVIHRDIKPANILLLEDRDRVQAKLTDFGIAKILHTPSLTQPGSVLGTVDYMSPEQCLGRDDVDERTDLYSLGVVFYESLTGRPPFRGISDFQVMQAHVGTPPEPPHLLNPDLLPSVVSVCLRALEKEVDNRYPSAAAILDDLDAMWPELERLDDVPVLLPQARVKATMDDAPPTASGAAAVDDLAGGETKLQSRATSPLAAIGSQITAARSAALPVAEPAAWGSDDGIGVSTERPVTSARTQFPVAEDDAPAPAARRRFRAAGVAVILAVAIAAAVVVVERDRFFGEGDLAGSAGAAGAADRRESPRGDPVRAMLDAGRLAEAADAAVERAAAGSSAEGIDLLCSVIERAGAALPPDRRLRVSQALEGALAAAAGRRPGLPADTLDAALRAGKALAAAGDVGSATKVIAAACRGVCPAEGAAEAFSALAAGIDVAGGFDEAFGVVRFLSSVPPDSAVYEPARRALGAARSALTARERIEAEDSLLAGRWSDGIASLDRLRKELGDQREFNRHLQLKAKEFQGATAAGPCVPIGLAGVRDPAAPSRNIGRPHVAWTGREYLVVWSDGRAAPETASTQQVHLQRLDAVGRRLEAADKTMSPPGVDARRPAVDFAGKHGGVAWHEVAGQGGRIVFVPIDFLGNAIGTPSVVAQAPTRSPFATVAVTRSESGSAYAVAWQGRETLTARSADSNGYVWVRVGAPATEAGRRTIVRDVATIAFLDDSGAVVDGPRTLEGPAVQRPDGNPGTRRGMPRPAWTRLPDVAGTPDGFVVTWEEDRSGDVAVIAAAFGPRGGEPLWTRAVAPEGVAPSSIEGRMPAVAVGGGRAAVIWVDRRPSPDVMFVSTLGPDGGILSTAPAARGTVRFLGGAITGDRIVAAWWMRGRPSRLGLIPCDLAGSCPMTAGSGDTPGDFPLVGPDSRVGLAPGAAVGEIVAVWKETPGSSGAADDDETDEGPTAGDEVFFVRFRCS